MNETQNINAEGEDDLLTAHGRRWYNLETLEVDPSVNSRYNGNARICWKGYEQLKTFDDRIALDYFWHFFPVEFMNKVVEATNVRLNELGYRKEMDLAELYEWLGIRLYMSIEPRKGDVEEFWKEGREDGSVYLGGSLRQLTNMTSHRWKLIRTALKFYNSDGQVHVNEARKPLSTYIAYVYVYYMY